VLIAFLGLAVRLQAVVQFVKRFPDPSVGSSGDRTW
jgi:hypothetical protein